MKNWSMQYIVYSPLLALSGSFNAPLEVNNDVAIGSEYALWSGIFCTRQRTHVKMRTAMRQAVKTD